MSLLMAYVIAFLFACAIYMMLRRSIVKLVIGLILLSNSANLLIFVLGGLKRNAPPLLSDSAVVDVTSYVDPLPQAMILTAIVISFGVLAYAVVLIRYAYGVLGTDDLNNMRNTDIE